MRRGEGKRFRDSERRSVRGGQKGRRPKLQKVAEAAAKRVAKAASIHPRQNAHQKNNDQEVPDPTIESNVDGSKGPILARERPRPRRVQ